MGKLGVDSWLGRVGLMNASSNKNKNKKASPTTAAAAAAAAAAATPTTSSTCTAESMKMKMKMKKKNNHTRSSSIGVVSFEVASLMSKAIHLWHSLADDQIARLRYEVFQTEGVRKLVSDRDDLLFSLALSEFMDSLGFLVRSVARLGKRCADPVLRRFDHVFTDLAISASAADLFGFQYAGNKMERKAKKMERLVAASSNLYHELEVLAELEQTLRRMKIQAKSDPSRRGSLADFKHKVVWQRQEVKRLREISVWNRTYDYTVRLLARSLFTILGRIKHVFGFHTTPPPPPDTTVTAALLLDDDDDKDKDKHSRGGDGKLSRCHSVAGLTQSSVHPSEFRCHRVLKRFSSGPLSAATDTTVGGRSLPHTTLPLPHPWKHRNWKKTKWQVSSRSLGGCMVAGADSPVLHSCIVPPVDGRLRGADAVPLRAIKGMKEDADKEASHFRGNISNCTNLYVSFEPLKAPPSTLGAAALALHYANVIIVIEKLALSPHLIGLDARDDLYSMLPTSIRAALRARLKSYAKNLTSSFYDPILAADWSDALSRILDWLAPLAHNMIRWQSERNFEQQQLASSANILLLQTLYFADQAKSEAAITELLVGLNYLWRFGRELTARAILECASSRNCGDILEL